MHCGIILKDLSNAPLVPMLVGARTLPTTATVQTIAGKKGHEYWLVFNECENVGQCKQHPSDQAAFYHDQVLPLIAAADPTAKLIIGGTSGLTNKFCVVTLGLCPRRAQSRFVQTNARNY